MPQFWYVLIQALPVRQSSTENDEIRVQNIDDARQGASQTVFVTLERRLIGYGIRGGVMPRVPFVVASQARARQEGLDTSVLTAITGLTGSFVTPVKNLRPGQTS